MEWDSLPTIRFSLWSDHSGVVLNRSSGGRIKMIGVLSSPRSFSQTEKLMVSSRILSGKLW